jgi:hypothetical protein
MISKMVSGLVYSPLGKTHQYNQPEKGWIFGSLGNREFIRALFLMTVIWTPNIGSFQLSLC